MSRLRRVSAEDRCGDWEGAGVFGAPALAKEFDPNQPRDDDGKWTDGLAHFEHVILPARGSGPNVEWVGPEDNDYALKPRAEGDPYPPVHPDEPHSSRDAEWPSVYGRGGGHVDTSPKNPGGIGSSTFTYWSESGSPRARREGGFPHHSLIRAEADEVLGLQGGERASVIDPLPREKYRGYARELVQGIARAKPAQPVLWRGIWGAQATAVAQSQEGDELHWSLGSTSRDAHVAKGYSGTGSSGFPGSGPGHGVVLRIAAGARGIANRGHFKHDQEVITGGRFRVRGKKMTKDGKRMIVDLEQIGVWQWPSSS